MTFRYRPRLAQLAPGRGIPITGGRKTRDTLPPLCDLVPQELKATCDPYCAACSRGSANGSSAERFVTAELEPEEPYVWDDPIEFELELLHEQLHDLQDRGGRCDCNG